MLMCKFVQDVLIVESTSSNDSYFPKPVRSESLYLSVLEATIGALYRMVALR